MDEEASFRFNMIDERDDECVRLKLVAFPSCP